MSKTKLAIALCAIALLLGGCASKEAYEAYRQSFDKSAEAYYLAAAEPLLDVKLPSPVKGEYYTIKVNREISPMTPAQIKDSEWADVARSGINAAGIVGGIVATGQATADLAKAVGGVAGVRVVGDHNTVSGSGNKATSYGYSTANAGNNFSGEPESTAVDSAFSAFSACSESGAYTSTLGEVASCMASKGYDVEITGGLMYLDGSEYAPVNDWEAARQ